MSRARRRHITLRLYLLPHLIIKFKPPEGIDRFGVLVLSSKQIEAVLLLNKTHPRAGDRLRPVDVYFRPFVEPKEFFDRLARANAAPVRECMFALGCPCLESSYLGSAHVVTNQVVRFACENKASENVQLAALLIKSMREVVACLRQSWSFFPQKGAGI